MEKKLKIYYTSDTHGYLFPTAYANRSEKPMGLMGVINCLKKDGNTLILDGGDTIQGSPLAYYAARNDPSMASIASVLNAGGYDYVTLGNHDFNHGHEQLANYLNALDAQCLCANVTDEDGLAKIAPYTVHVMENGLRVGLVGIVTDHVKIWEYGDNLKGLTIGDPFAAAAQALEQLKPVCDVTICIYHGGFECDLDTGEQLAPGTENIGYRICRELSFDLLLTAHQHMPIPGRQVLGSYVVQPPANATGYLQLDIAQGEDGIKITSRLCAPTANCNPALYSSLLPLENTVQQWLDEPVGSFDTEIPALSKVEIAVHGSAVADFINTVQLDCSGADFSCTCLANDPVGLPLGVTMRDIVSAYRFPNTLTVLEVDEDILRTALERCAQYLTLVDGQPQVSDCFLIPKAEHYNYDFFAGFTYQFDLRRPVGQRVTELLRDGKPLVGKYSLCMNNYRASGTGGYEVFRSCPVLGMINTEVPQLAADYLRSHGTVAVSPSSPISVVW